MKIINLIMILLGLFLFVVGYFNRRRKTLNEELILLSYITGFFIILFSLFPSITNHIAKLMGVSRGVDLLTYISIPLLFYLVILLYVKVNELNEKLTKMVREDSINKAKRLKK